jgi:hypothetical protein
MGGKSGNPHALLRSIFDAGTSLRFMRLEAAMHNVSYAVEQG